jgi:hypothetical protein
MVVPQKSDPKWGTFLNGLGSLQPEYLATKMLMNRLKLKMAMNPGEATRKEAIDAAYDFFIKNQSTVADDIQRIFA